MATAVEIPQMGESVAEVVLLEWLKTDGEYVERDEAICVLETDKANVDLPAPVAGVLQTLKAVDETLEVGDQIAVIDESATPAEQPVTSDNASAAPVEIEAPPLVPEPPPAPEPAPTPPEPAGPPAAEPSPAAAAAPTSDLSPAVRRLVEEHGLNPGAITGSGRDGRLTKEDVLAHLETVKPAGGPIASPASPESVAPVAAAAKSSASAEDSGATGAGAAGVRRVAMTKIRRRIAERLVAAQQNAAMLTTFNEVDLGAVMELRAKHKERFAEVHGVSLGLMSFFSRAAALSLKAYEAVNASIDGTDILYHDYVNLGIAVSAERGLVVPVLRGAESMTLAQLETEIKRLAKAARDNKLSMDELSGGTFTITNGGIFGSLMSTPILNPPQSGILGMHAIKERPAAVDGQVVVRPMMYLALSYDHRIVDGEQSVSFLVRIKELLEDPTRLMLEI